MGYIVKARYYAESDNFGESYVITSDNNNIDLDIEVGKSVEIVEVAQKKEEAPGTIDNNAMFQLLSDLKERVMRGQPESIDEDCNLINRANAVLAQQKHS